MLGSWAAATAVLARQCSSACLALAQDWTADFHQTRNSLYYCSTGPLSPILWAEKGLAIFLSLTTDWGCPKTFGAPWLVWFSGLSADLWTKGSPVRFPVRAHAWVVGQIPRWGRIKGNHALMFFFLFLPLFPSLKKGREKTLWWESQKKNKTEDASLYWLLFRFFISLPHLLLYYFPEFSASTCMYFAQGF